MSLIHVQDVAGQLIHVAEQGTKSNDYNIYGSEVIAQENFAKTLADEINIETEVLSSDEIEIKYGKTVNEALTSSMPVKTQHINWRASYKFKFPDWSKMVRELISTVYDN